MPSAQGFVKCISGSLEGTFDVDGSSRYITVDVKPLNQSFECSNATLAYDNVAQLLGDCKWTGAAGKDDLQMDFGRGVSITGPLAARRPSSVRIRGAGTWSTAKSSLHPPPTNSADDSQGNIMKVPADRFSHDPVRDAAKLRRERQLLESGNPIIAIFGQSGVGKSTFTNLISSEKQKVGKGLQSCTSEISVVEAQVGGKSIVVIDTPGIDNTRPGMREADVLADIAGHLGAMGAHGIWVTGVLFLHRISDNKFSQTADRISNMLKSLCGDDAMSHLMLCTTMWDRVSEDIGHDRFDELCDTSAWEEMISMGASTGMISNVDRNAKKEAEKIMGELIKHAKPVEVAIQDEMVKQRKTVAQTGAGKVLSKHLRAAQAEAERKVTELQEKWRKDKETKEELLRAQELEVARLRQRAEEEYYQRQAQADYRRQEWENANREPEELREISHYDENISKVDEPLEMTAEEQQSLETWKRVPAPPRAPKPKQLQQQIKRAERELKKLEKRLTKEDEAETAAREKAILALQFEISEAQRQVAVLDIPQRGLFWWVNPTKWWQRKAH